MLPMMGGNRRRDQNIVLLFLSDALDARAACAHAVPNKIFLNCERVYSLVVFIGVVLLVHRQPVACGDFVNLEDLPI